MKNRIEIIGDCTLYLGDCLDIIPTLDKVDAVITDPPYNYKATKGADSFKGGCKIFQQHKLSGMESFDANIFIPPILGLQNIKNGFYFCSRQGIYQYLHLAKIYNLEYDVLIWHKPNAIPFGTKTFKSDFEYIIRLYSKNGAGLKINQQRKLFVYNLNQEDSKYYDHPTIKPLPLIKQLIKIVTNKNDIVFDGFMGSGTTGVACAEMGRKFIGIEKELKYFDIACKRLYDAYRQGKLI